MSENTRKNTFLQTDARRDLSGSMVWKVRSTVWQPPTDIYEREDELIIKMEIAGLQLDNLQLSMEDNILIVAGMRSDSNELGRAYHQMEIPFGKFTVSIELSFSVTVESSLMDYKDGFLIIRLPKEK